MFGPEDIILKQKHTELMDDKSIKGFSIKYLLFLGLQG